MANGDRKMLQVIRWLFDIVEEVLAGPRTLADLQLLSGAQEREADTIKRDIMLLRDLGWDIPKNQKAYRIESTTFPLLILEREAEALQRLGAIAQRLKLPEADAIEQMVQRLPAGLRRSGHEAVADYTFWPASADFRRHSEIVRKIDKALIKGQRFEVAHRRADKSAAVRYLCDAGRLHWEQGSVYFVGYVKRLDKPDQEFQRRELRVDRIEEVKPHKEPRMFGSPPDLYTFRFWASAKIVPFLADTEAQRVVHKQDGSAEVVAKALNLLRAKQRVLAYGRDARATMPDELVKVVAADARAAAELYGAASAEDAGSIDAQRLPT